MIVEFEDLRRYRRGVAMVDGGFDPLHHGHIRYFEAARRLGMPVLCNISPDAYVGRKHPPLLPADERAEIIDALRSIDLTHVSHRSTAAVLGELQPKYYVKGKDWEGRLPEEEVKVCRRSGIEIVYLDTVVESSTGILDRYLSQIASRNGDVEAFERYVFEQHPVPAGHYDAEYFTGEWREGGNTYRLETRRKIEGRNPALIKEVFRPKRVLDVGCGPGILMYLLQELGVEADGIDFSPRSRELAPPEVRDRIMIAAVTDPAVPEKTYDLVVCREVFEHLTVLEIRRAVWNICRASARFVYVTTRFHPAPQGLLDVTTQFEVDPTHITLLNKDLLRVLFVLEGFRSRPDLEGQMDWLQKGRVLVFERGERP